MKALIQRRATELGFDLCRVASADPPASGPRFLEALAEGRHAEMNWLARNAEKRLSPQLVLPGAKSVVMLAVSYASRPGSPAPGDAPRGVVARYARFDDYHDVLAAPLQKLAGLLDSLGGSAPDRCGMWTPGPFWSATWPSGPAWGSWANTPT